MLARDFAYKIMTIIYDNTYSSLIFTKNRKSSKEKYFEKRILNFNGLQCIKNQKS